MPNLSQNPKSLTPKYKRYKCQEHLVKNCNVFHKRKKKTVSLLAGSFKSKLQGLQESATLPNPQLKRFNNC